MGIGQTKNRVMLAALVVLFLLIFVPTAAAQEEIDIVVSQIVQEGDEVKVYMRLTGPGSENSSLDAVTVSENGQLVTLTSGPSLEEAPIGGYVIVNDIYARENQLGAIKRVVNDYIEDKKSDHSLEIVVFREQSYESVSSYTVDNGVLTTQLENYQTRCGPQCGERQELEPIAILNDFIRDTEPSSEPRPAYVLFISGVLFFELGGDIEADFLPELREKDLQVYTYLMDGTPGSQGNRKISNLATASGGKVFTSDVRPDQVFEQINNDLGRQFVVTYALPADAEAGVQREVQVTSEALGVSARSVYTPAENAAPELAPEAEPEAVEVAFSDIGYSTLEDGSHQFVLGIESLPDGVSLGPGTLTVGDAVIGAPQNPNEAGQYVFVVPANDLSGGEQPVSIDLTDSNGVAYPQQANVSIVVPEPPPSEGLNVITLASIGLIALAVVGAGVYYFVSRGNDGGSSSSSSNSRETMLITGDDEDLAYLILLEGVPNVGRRVPINGTTVIGRDGEFADIRFHQNDDRSPLSRRHCTIMEEDGRFKVRDDESRNGTYLNGYRLPKNEANDLRDGDEIELASVEKGGVKVKFVMANQPYVDNTGIFQSDDQNDDLSRPLPATRRKPRVVSSDKRKSDDDDEGRFTKPFIPN